MCARSGRRARSAGWRLPRARGPPIEMLIGATLCLGARVCPSRFRAHLIWYAPVGRPLPRPAGVGAPLGCASWSLLVDKLMRHDDYLARSDEPDPGPAPVGWCARVPPTSTRTHRHWQHQARGPWSRSRALCATGPLIGGRQTSPKTTIHAI